MRTKRSGEAQTWIFFQLQLARIASNSSPFKAGTESFTYTRAQQYLSTALSESDPVPVSILLPKAVKRLIFGPKADRLPKLSWYPIVM